jgi:hypothetical protein
VLLALAGSLAFAAQDRYTLKIPDGLAWSEFRGYETWQNVAVSQTETSLKVIAANDAMINAYRDGVPDNGKLFPDGSKITKIEWSFKRNAVSPYFVTVPDTLVAQRYHRRLRLFNAPKNFVTRLHELRDIVKDGCSDEDANKFRKKVDELVEATTNKLNEPRR